MATVISNQATLSYTAGGNTGVAASNVATTVLQGAITMTKSAMAESYADGRHLTYLISLTNAGTTEIAGLTVTDDLGAYEVSQGVTAVPLTYVGPSMLFVNGVSRGEITPAVTEGTLTYQNVTVPAQSTATIIYIAEVNGYAPVSAGSTVTNTAAVTGEALTEDLTDSVTLTAETFADVSVLKTMTPNPVYAGGTLTNTFELYNYGNIEATDVVLTDAFDPAPTGLTVTVNGTVYTPSEYTYTAGTLTLPSGTGTDITVPAATYTVDPATGLVSTAPGRTTVIVTGTV